MRKAETALTVLLLIAVADLLVFVRTLELRPVIETSSALAAMAAEIAAGVVILWLAFELFRRSYRRQKKPASRWHFAVVQPLRRLFVSVWS